MYDIFNKSKIYYYKENTKKEWSRAGTREKLISFLAEIKQNKEFIDILKEYQFVDGLNRKIDIRDFELEVQKIEKYRWKTRKKGYKILKLQYIYNYSWKTGQRNWNIYRFR